MRNVFLSIRRMKKSFAGVPKNPLGLEIRASRESSVCKLNLRNVGALGTWGVHQRVTVMELELSSGIAWCITQNNKYLILT